MDTSQPPILGVFLFFVITVAYIILVVIIQNKLSGILKKRGQRFREEAERDGRKVTAYLKDYAEDYTDGKRSYSSTYYYTAPNGKRYKMKAFDCIHDSVPSEERTLYLHPMNYRKYYKGNMTLGQHPNLFVAVTLIIYFGFYYRMMRMILPILLP